jgi:hypothetical protein
MEMAVGKMFREKSDRSYAKDLEVTRQRYFSLGLELVSASISSMDEGFVELLADGLKEFVREEYDLYKKAPGKLVYRPVPPEIKGVYPQCTVCKMPCMFAMFSLGNWSKDVFCSRCLAVGKKAVAVSPSCVPLVIRQASSVEQYFDL